MREIKFRAWHKEKRILVRVIDFYLSDGTVHLPIETDITDEYWWDSTTWDLEDVELMQYTGLVDKNGTEIYEGDIFRDNDTFLWRVAYEDGAFVAKGGEYKMTEALIEFAPEHCEVIGNIYENPELMEVD